MVVALPDAVRDRVAQRMVARWRRRRLSQVDLDDVRSEAITVMHEAARRYTPDRGDLEPFLVVTCIRELDKRITRAAQPASGRSSADIPALMQLREVRIEPRDAPDPLDYDDLVYRTQLRARMREIVARRYEDHEVLLSIMLDLTSVTDEAVDKKHATHLYNCIARAKKLLREDKILAQMLEDL